MNIYVLLMCLCIAIIPSLILLSCLFKLYSKYKDLKDDLDKYFKCEKDLFINLQADVTLVKRKVNDLYFSTLEDEE